MFYYICVFIYKTWKVPKTRKKTIVVTVHKNELGYHVVHAFLSSVYAENFNLSVSFFEICLYPHATRCIYFSLCNGHFLLG